MSVDDNPALQPIIEQMHKVKGSHWETELESVDFNVSIDIICSTQGVPKNGNMKLLQKVSLILICVDIDKCHI